eukprot:9195545-Pyramimonas_sp.AAC.1
MRLRLLVDLCHAEFAEFVLARLLAVREPICVHVVAQRSCDAVTVAAALARLLHAARQRRASGARARLKPKWL